MGSESFAWAGWEANLSQDVLSSFFLEVTSDGAEHRELSWVCLQSPLHSCCAVSRPEIPELRGAQRPRDI